jgi:TPR repeat protein
MTKKSIFAGLQHTSKIGSSEQRRSVALIYLCFCYTSGFGVRANNHLAAKSLIEAAMMNNIAAQALVKRMHDALGVELGQLPITDWLTAAAETGSVIASEDLKDRDPKSTSSRGSFAAWGYKSLAMKF